ncbi:hypothetical protein VB779_03395 [Haloarculaceae archaeon H-GB11]|nr:hypothetical protein [Haloarculaceae archaeon H-GB11]
MSLHRRTLRGVFAALVVVSTATLVFGYVEAEQSGDQVTGDPAVERAFRTGDRSPVVAPRDRITVVATDSNAFLSDENDSPRAQAELAAFAPNGSIYYYENDHTRYWDVDPVPGTATTVEYVYADHLTAEECHSESVCTRNGVERVNLTTGERTEIYSRITPGKHSTRWHDVDRIDEHRLLVADIAQDRIFVVNTTTELVQWEWDAQADYNVSSGGPYPEDWTHINDVEHVEIDGREAAMVSVRNHDQVAFIDYERGLMENWTLGADDAHDTLYEQHNPDYIPQKTGAGHPRRRLREPARRRVPARRWGVEPLVDVDRPATPVAAGRRSAPERAHAGYGLERRPRPRSRRERDRRLAGDRRIPVRIGATGDG